MTLCPNFRPDIPVIAGTCEIRVARDTAAPDGGLSQLTMRFPPGSPRVAARGWRVTAPRACPRFRALSLVLPETWQPRVARDTPSPGPSLALTPTALVAPHGTCAAARAHPRDGDPDPRRVVPAPRRGRASGGTLHNRLPVSLARSPPGRTTSGTPCSGAAPASASSWRGRHRARSPRGPSRRTSHPRPAATAVPVALTGALAGPSTPGPPSSGTTDSPPSLRNHRQSPKPSHHAPVTVTDRRHRGPATVKSGGESERFDELAGRRTTLRDRPHPGSLPRARATSSVARSRRGPDRGSPRALRARRARRADLDRCRWRPSL